MSDSKRDGVAIGDHPRDLYFVAVVNLIINLFLVDEGVDQAAVNNSLISRKPPGAYLFDGCDLFSELVSCHSLSLGFWPVKIS